MAGRRAGASIIMPAAAFTAAVAFGSAAQAQALNDKYWIEVSAFFPSADTQATVSRPGAPGTELDLEQDLGLKKHETLPAVYAGARFGRWVVNGEYYGLDRNGSRIVSRDINFDGATFPANVEVDSKMRSNVYRLSVGYSFIRNDRAELGAVIGLHATDFKIALEGQATVGAGSVQTENRRHKFLAPMPTVGAYGTYEITPQVILTGRADYMSLKISDYDGSILNLQAAVAYRVPDMIEVGAAYRYVDYNLDVEKSTYTADINYDFTGPSVFVRFGFR